jgi:hypothetical protein
VPEGFRLRSLRLSKQFFRRRVNLRNRFIR